MLLHRRGAGGLWLRDLKTVHSQTGRVACKWDAGQGPEAQMWCRQ